MPNIISHFTFHFIVIIVNVNQLMQIFNYHNFLSIYFSTKCSENIFV